MVLTECVQFLVGLPDSGKTTFLAALWHVVNSHQVQGSLQLERLDGDSAHLNNIQQLWADARPLDRTKTSHEQVVSMKLRDPVTDGSAELTIPDFSGESFEYQWAKRQMSVEHAGLYEKATGGLLLIHPRHVREPVLIQYAEQRMKYLDEAEHASDENVQELSGLEEAEPGNEANEALWSARNAPTQIKLVELLQFIVPRSSMRPLKLAVVVSAWDLVTERVLPGKWVAQRLPLLSQYLLSNRELFAVKYYGISAQGGDLKNADELRTEIRPSKRIVVVGEGASESHDISLPIKWIMQAG